MPVIENTPQRLVLKSGSTILTLDKLARKATLQRKFLLWVLKPTVIWLPEVVDIVMDTAIDRASSVEVCHTTLVIRGGHAWRFPAKDKMDAEANTAALRLFLGLAT